MTDATSSSFSSEFIDEIVLRNARNNPDKCAITSGADSLTYAELDVGVRNLVNLLLESGAKPGDMIAVFMESGYQVSITLLAVQAIGCIYAPLDPQHTLSQLMEKSQIISPRFIIHDAGRKQMVAQIPMTDCVTVEWVPDRMFLPTGKLPKVERSLEDPACIFFTSGTTGAPKAIVGSARALREAVLQPAKHLSLSASDTVNALARSAWSISMLELLAPLVVGGTSRILNREKALNFDWLLEQLSHCTCFHSPPALLKSLSEYVNSIELQLKHIRLVWYGGDTLSAQSIAQVMQAFPNAYIGTAYGTTEIFGLSHIHFYARKSLPDAVLIGRPVPGMKQHIAWDEGASNMGELHLGGDRVFSGYWKNGAVEPRATIQVSGTDFYPTGDFVRQQVDGALEFIERRDDQVKIRGIRVEIQEINKAIAKLPGVKEVVTLASKGDHETKRLKSFIVGQGLDAQALKKALQQWVPDYMIPEEIHLLEKFPVTENFKIDYKKLNLLKPDVAAVARDTSDAVVELILAAWKKHAKIQTAELNDNFFERGGNSMSAAILAASLTREIGKRVDVADIYNCPTVNQLAAAIRKKTQAGQAAAVASYPASYGQIGLFFRELKDKTDGSITCTRYILNALPYDDGFIVDTIKLLVERHPTLKSRIVLKSGQLTIQEVPTKDLLMDRGLIRRCPPVQDLSVVGKTHHTFHASDNRPLICAIITPVEGKGELLQLTAQHIACDDNSMGRIAREFCVIYRALISGRVPRLAKSDPSYGNFAQSQHGNRAHYEQKAVPIANELVRRLKTQSPPAQSATGTINRIPLHDTEIPFSNLVALCSWALTPDHSQRSFTACLHVALERDSDEAPKVGMFVNLVPLFVDCDRNASFEEHVLHCKNRLTEALAHSDIPFEVILRAQPTLRKLGQYPFDFYLNELNFTDTEEAPLENIYINRSFSTDKNELSFTLVKTLDGQFIHVEGPEQSLPAGMLHRLASALGG